MDLIEYGFPLDFDRTRKLVSTLQNHASAKNYPSHVDKYIQEELSHNAILGPLDRKPFDVHISPLMTRDKSNSDCRRTIFDLSFPKGYSVNDGVLKDSYLGTKFQMHYPTVDIIVKNLNDLGPGANIFKVDISRAFRHIRIDPGDIDLLALQHRYKLYLELSLPFGYRLGAFFFSKISDAVRYIMSQNGHNALLNYIDDLIYCGLPSKIHKPYQFLVGLLQELGLDISQKKLQPPDTCLGIEFDTIHRTMSIPAQKLEEIMQICKNWTNKSKVQKADLQSLLGYLLYITKCVKPARFFLNRMLQLLWDNVHEDTIVLNQEFFKDLAWFNTFLNSYNGVTIYQVTPLYSRIFLDASLQGMGGCFNNYVYSLPIPLGFRNYNIAHLEMINVMVALKIWGHCWTNKCIRIFCDNLAVVEVLTFGKAKDAILATCAHNIWLLTAIFNVNLLVTHIKGNDNTVADLLSRWNTTPNNVKKLHQMVECPLWIDTHIDLTLFNHDI